MIKKPRILGIISLPTRLTRRSSRPAWEFGILVRDSSARMAVRDR